MIKLGNTARYVREKHQLTQRVAATRLGISNVHLCNIEKNNAYPSPQILEKYRDEFGVDLYVLAWCLFGDVKKLPASVRPYARELAKEWKKQLEISGGSVKCER